MSKDDHINESVKTIPNDARVDFVSYHPKFSAICSIGFVPFHGTVTITYHPRQRLLEFKSFETWLRGQVDVETTAEGFCRIVFDKVYKTLCDSVRLRVEVHAETVDHGPVTVAIESGEWKSYALHRSD